QHLRALAFEDYFGSRWHAPSEGITFRKVELSELRANSPGKNYTVDILGDMNDPLVLPLNAAAIDSEAALERDRLGAIRHPQGIASARYGFTASDNENFQGPLCLPAPDRLQLASCLAFPSEVDSKVADLAVKVAGYAPPLVRVLRIVQYLRSTHA